MCVWGAEKAHKKKSHIKLLAQQKCPLLADFSIVNRDPWDTARQTPVSPAGYPEDFSEDYVPSSFLCVICVTPVCVCECAGWPQQSPIFGPEEQSCQAKFRNVGNSWAESFL